MGRHRTNILKTAACWLGFHLWDSIPNDAPDRQYNFWKCKCCPVMSYQKKGGGPFILYYPKEQSPMLTDDRRLTEQDWQRLRILLDVCASAMEEYRRQLFAMSLPDALDRFWRNRENNSIERP